ncbi:MAG: hypothetical protein ABL984_12605 [Pyrinomonadaceae bacterium]
MYDTAHPSKEVPATIRLILKNYLIDTGSLYQFQRNPHFMGIDSQIPLVGGSGHGQSIQVDSKTDEIELDVHTSEKPGSESTFTETYERRHFDGDGFGDGLDCLSLKSDDSTEQMELARWSVSQAPNVAK